MDNDQTPQNLPPTTELPSIQQPNKPTEQTKTLEEISGIKSQLNTTATPETETPVVPGAPMHEEASRSKAELYSKITSIAVPVLVAVVLVTVGTFAYKLLLSPKDTPEPIPEDIVENVETEIMPDTSDLMTNELAEDLEYAIKQGIEGGAVEKPLEEPVKTPGAPTITPITITPLK